MRTEDVGSEVDITFFVPCLNEEANIVATLETIGEAVRRAGVSFEVLVWDDASSDRTVAVVEGYRSRHPGLPLRLERNTKTMGLARNFVDAAFAGRGKYFKMVTGDNAELAADMVTILSHRGEADVVIPYFRIDSRTPARRLLSQVFTGLVNLLSGLNLRYYNGAALHLRYNIMRWHSDTYGFAYQAEILTRLLSEGASWIEVPIAIAEKGGRVSKALTVKNLLSVGHSLLQMLLRRVRRALFEV